MVGAHSSLSVERLRILREFADRGTIGAVAAALSMTPSAVSQQLKVLTREAGVTLLEPSGRRVRLTDAGHALVVRADEVLAALERAVAEMAHYRGSARGRVRVALFPSGAGLSPASDSVFGAVCAVAVFFRSPDASAGSSSDEQPASASAARAAAAATTVEIRFITHSPGSATPEPPARPAAYRVARDGPGPSRCELLSIPDGRNSWAGWIGPGPAPPKATPSDTVVQHHIQFGGGEQSFQPLVDLGVSGRIIGFDRRELRQSRGVLAAQ